MPNRLQIDILKGLAIMSVIIIHSIPEFNLKQIGAPFHFRHAVAIFMLIAGYNGVSFYRKRNILKLREMYSYKLIARRVKRLYTPTFFIWFLELIFVFLVFKDQSDFMNIIRFFPAGGFGPGGYFIHITLQNILLVPLLYWAAINNPKKLFVYAFVVDLLFEVISYKFGMHSGIYRVLGFRYLFALALGVLYATSYKSHSFKKHWIIVSIAISLIYLIAVPYAGVKLPFNPAWYVQNLFAYPWSFLLFIWFIKGTSNIKENIITLGLSEIGKASLHVLLVQMLYFWMRESLTIYPEVNLINTVFDITICVLFGYMFFRFEKKLGNLFKDRVFDQNT